MRMEASEGEKATWAANNRVRSHKLGRVGWLVRVAVALIAAAGMVSCSGGGSGGGTAASSGGPGVGVGAPPGICGTAVALSSCTPDASRNLTIGGSQCSSSNVYVDQSFIGKDAFNTITINSGATLCFPDQSAELDVGTILDSGTLQVGQVGHPIGSTDPAVHITLNFQGARPCPIGTTCTGFNKGIEVLSGGALQMYGTKGVPPNGIDWTYLSQPAGPPDKYSKGSGVTVPVDRDGAFTLRLADDVGSGSGAWQKGDWIAVATTSFSPFETEFVKIADIKSKPADNPSGSDVYLSTPLRYYHFGSAAPEAAATYPSAASYNDGPSQNYGVDERAEVGLISRNIVLTATIPPSDANSIHWGGELRFLQGFAQVSIQGVELQKFGKDQLGSYPIHFHMDGNVNNTPLVDSNSIDHSYDKCVTVHSTQNITISNNVCARAVGHLFYEEIGDEQNVTYMHNLGMGAMSSSFNINGTPEVRANLIKKYWWIGDNMTNDPQSPDYIGYDGFNIPDLDATTNPVHGSCAALNNAGQLFGYKDPNATAGVCPADRPIYVEPASGFWILNPGTNLVGNAIAGCQGTGVGYWYVVPQTGSFVTLPLTPVGKFQSNRVSACFDGLFGENQYSIQSAGLLHPLVGGTPGGQNLLAEFDGLTATRIRDRGVWMRDQWFVINHGRFATDRDGASLLTAGGADGATPGDWMLVENSVFEGLSQNNVDRFGPCPKANTSFIGQQPLQGCIDQTPAPNGTTPLGGDEIGKGYPDPSWNPAGYMIYDGPARLVHDRFVDFNIQPAFTTDDSNAVKAWAASHFLLDAKNNKVPWVYEGDAALGWFQSNQSSYPTLTNTAQLSFVNTDLRHQIYTQLVNLGKDPSNPNSGFGDGDKNTAIIDLDGTLSGFLAFDAANDPVTNFDDPHPISLNNLMINAASNSVDECLAQGGQDAVLEKRPTSLMSPSSMASLEFQAIYPPLKPPPTQTNPLPLQKQNLTFTKDSIDFGAHQSMTLSSRNALGVWEPKVTSGLGYTVAASVDTTDGGTAAGVPKVVDVGIIDAYKSHMSAANPFYVRVGICYSNASGGHPASASDFSITQGYHSYGGGTLGTPDDLELRKYYNKLANLYTPTGGTSQTCDNLNGVNQIGDVPQNVCPANGISLASQGCPAGTTTATDNRGQMVCVYPTSTLTAATSIGAITNPDGTYKSLNQYYYDPSTGWLFFYVAQTVPNSIGPSPLGNCGQNATVKDPACPNNAIDESYYVCPAQGCTDYVVTVTDPSYTPGKSTCPSPYPTYAVPEPTQPYHLAYVGGTTPVVRVPAGGGTNFPHYQAMTAPACQ